MVRNCESKRCKEESGAYIEVVKICLGGQMRISPPDSRTANASEKNECHQRSSRLFLGKIKRRVPPHSFVWQETGIQQKLLIQNQIMLSSFLKASGTGVSSRFQRKRENATWIKRKKPAPEPCRSPHSA
jgi:hypothetical protein